MVFDELDRILLSCEVEEGKGREVAHLLRNIKFHSRDPGKRDGPRLPEMDWLARVQAGRMGSRIANLLWGGRRGGDYSIYLQFRAY